MNTVAAQKWQAGTRASEVAHGGTCCKESAGVRTNAGFWVRLPAVLQASSNDKGVGLDAAGGQSRTTAGLCAGVGEAE